MSPKNFIIGTAGHIDHGKTTLIKALSGTDTDRLTEEKKRGISIDLGFTNLNLKDQYTLGIVDVPGHEKFIKNMLAGAGGVDIALLVIAADEGIMAQTREHLDILSLLNVKEGIIALTKIDKVENEWVELMAEEIKDKLSDTIFKDSPIVPVSATESKGINKLKTELIKIVESMEDKNLNGNIYFPIDRVFTIKGHGTIVTGTLISGKIDVDDNLIIYPSHKDVRVRSLEVHNKSSKEAYPGQRVGINLSGIDKDEIQRGDVLATNDSLKNTKYLDGRLKVLKNLSFVIEHGDRIRFHIGAKEVIGRIYLLDKKELLPGENGLVQYRLEEDVVARYNENYVIRRYSPMTTIGGGNIIDNYPPQRKRFKQKSINELFNKERLKHKDRIEYIIKLKNKNTVKPGYLVKKTGLKKVKVIKILNQLTEEEKVKLFKKGAEKSWFHIDNYDILCTEIIKILNEFHNHNKLKQGISKEELRTRLSVNLDTLEFNQLLEDLEEKEKIAIISSNVKIYNYKIKLNDEEKKLKDSILKDFKDNKFTPPDINEIIGNDDKKEEVFNYLLDNKKILHIKENIFFHFSAVKEAKEILLNHFENNKYITLAEYRDLLDSSRKFALALLEYFDQNRITKREGENRTLIN